MCEVSSWRLMFATALLLLQATFHSPRLVESSGVAVSRADPGVLWTHNDSGDGPYLYAADLRGTDRGALLVPGAQAIDWEDMSLGPCPVAFPLQPRPPPSNAPTRIYLAGTGDNLEFRPFVTIYAIPEPAPPARASDTAGTTRAPAVLRLRYPDGVHDVEAVYVSPRDTAVYLVSKGVTRGSAIRVYRVDRRAWRTPDTTSDIVVATLVQTLDIRPQLRGGATGNGGCYSVRRPRRGATHLHRDLPLLSWGRWPSVVRAPTPLQHRRDRDRRRSDRL